MAGYLRYKRASDILQNISEEISNGESKSNKEKVKDYFSYVEHYAELVKDKIDNADSGQNVQIDQQSFTENEWN